MPAISTDEPENTQTQPAETTNVLLQVLDANWALLVVLGSLVIICIVLHIALKRRKAKTNLTTVHYYPRKYSMARPSLSRSHKNCSIPRPSGINPRPRIQSLKQQESDFSKILISKEMLATISDVEEPGVCKAAEIPAGEPKAQTNIEEKIIRKKETPHGVSRKPKKIKIEEPKNFNVSPESPDHQITPLLHQHSRIVYSLPSDDDSSTKSNDNLKKPKAVKKRQTKVKLVAYNLKKSFIDSAKQPITKSVSSKNRQADQTSTIQVSRQQAEAIQTPTKSKELLNLHNMVDSFQDIMAVEPQTPAITVTLKSFTLTRV